MLLTIVWGISGMLGVLLIVFIGVAALLGGFAYAREGGLGTWKALGCYVLSACCAVVAVAGGWGATHVRTVDLTVAHTRIETDRHLSYYVDDTSGTSYDTSSEVYVQLDKGDHVRCRATSPLLFLEATILSCKRAPKR